MNERSVNVALVGAGPGAPDLITVRGLRYLQTADIVIHDRLVSPQLLGECKSGVSLINVGKAPHRNRFPQEEINAILVEQAHTGKRVVRLKGGDPFVFGLGSSEALSLANAGIAFEVVPGVSSSVALTGLAGIPLTMKDQLTSFTVLSGHYPPGHPKSADFDNISQNGMVVILMGRKNISLITSRFISNGWPIDTQVALIASGTTSQETIVLTTLSRATEEAENLSAPLTIAIGKGVAIRPQLLPYLQQAQYNKNDDAWGKSREIEK